MDEKLCLSRAKAGDREAFESIIACHEQKIYALCYKFMGNEHDACDAFQEVLLKIYLNLAKFKENSAFSTWVYRIAVNTCLDIIRKRKNIVSLEDYDEKSNFGNPEEDIISKETQNAVMQSISLLEEKYRSVLVLKELEYKSYDEISFLLNISVGTVKSRLFRAREKLKEILKRKRVI